MKVNYVEKAYRLRYVLLLCRRSHSPSPLFELRLAAFDPIDTAHFWLEDGGDRAPARATLKFFVTTPKDIPSYLNNLAIHLQSRIQIVSFAFSIAFETA